MMAISEKSTIQLITSAEEADMSRQIALLMNGIKSANVPLQTNPHGLYVRPFQNEEKILIEVPPEYDEMVSLLVDAIGDFYTFQEISERAGRAALDLRRTISLDIQGAAMELTQSFSRPLEDAIKEPSIYFVPLSGVNIAVPVPLGPATFLPTEQAQTLVVEWKQRHNVASDPNRCTPICSRPHRWIFAH